MPNQSPNDSLPNSEHRWPWPEDRWVQRLAGIDQTLDETIALANKQMQEREAALKRHQPNFENANAGPDPVIEPIEHETDAGPMIPLPHHVPAELAGGGGNDYYLLPDDYQEGTLADLFQNDSERARIQIGLGMLNNMKTFLESVNNELASLFAEPESGVFSQSYINQQLLSKISTDINIVQQALWQRGLNPATQKITHQGFVLKVGDSLAAASLQKVKDTDLLPKHVTPYSYLQNRIDIRLIPYYDVVLLSVPYGVMNSTCNWLATDYLAIPHEIGHYLFWWGTVVKEDANRVLEEHRHPAAQEGNGRIAIRETLETATEGEPDWVKAWLEELFADAVGCLIAGPISILGFQELLTSSSPKSLEGHDQDDHAHPFPSLRPFVQTAFLRKMGDYEMVADELDANWEKWVETSWPDLRDPLAHAYKLDNMEPMTGNAIREHLARPGGILEKILNVLNAMNDKQCWTGNQSLDKLYERFISGSFLSSDIETIVPPQSSAALTMRNKRIGPRDAQLDEIFMGWSTEGPHGGDPGI